MSEQLGLLHWVRSADGQLVPFEPDRLCRRIFAALAALGRHEPFTARELTDCVLHFLDGAFTAPPTSAELRDFAVKVIREAGDPLVALQLQRSAAPVGKSTAPLPADLAEAVAVGLLHVAGLESPERLRLWTAGPLTEAVTVADLVNDGRVRERRTPAERHAQVPGRNRERVGCPNWNGSIRRLPLTQSTLSSAQFHASPR